MAEEKYKFKTLDGLETIPLTKREARNIERFFTAVMGGLLALSVYTSYKIDTKEVNFEKVINRYPSRMFNPN